MLLSTILTRTLFNVCFLREFYSNFNPDDDRGGRELDKVKYIKLRVEVSILLDYEYQRNPQTTI